MSQGGPSRSAGSASGSPIETITGNVGGPVGPDAGFNFNLTANTTMGITTIGNAGTNTINILALQSSTTQLGTIQLATNAESIAGTDTAKAITADDLKAKLGTQTQFALPIGAGNSSAISWTAAPTDGQLLIGFGGANPTLGTLTAGTGISITNAPGSITINSTATTTYSYTSVNHAASPYTVLNADQYIAVNSSGGPVTILLPDAPATGKFWIIKDKNGSSFTNNITVTTVSGVDSIDGVNNYIYNTTFEAANFIFNGAGYEVF